MAAVLPASNHHRCNKLEVHKHAHSGHVDFGLQCQIYQIQRKVQQLAEAIGRMTQLTSLGLGAPWGLIR